MIALAAVLAACAADSDPPAAPAPVDASSAGDGVLPPAGSEVVIVLPPADALADVELERVRILVGRAAEEGLPADAAAVVLAPASADALGPAIEAAVRRAGSSGTVCLVGADGAATSAPVLALYPASRFCLLPAGATSGSGTPLTSDVDLGRLGRELGTAARAAAGAGTVLLLAGGDAMLDRRWREGVTAGAAGSVHTVARADVALALLDAQAMPDDPGRTGPEPFDEGDPPLALTLPTITVVVLDASPEAGRLVVPLLERGMLVVGPRSLLTGLPAGVSDEGVVLRWRVRWDVPFTALLRRVGTVTGTADTSASAEPAWDDVVVLEPGRAHVAP